MIFSVSDIIMKRKRHVHDGNIQQSFAALPLKPNGQTKKDKRNRISSDPAVFRHKTPSKVRCLRLPKLNTSAKSMGECIMMVAPKAAKDTK
jgi:hypothetical protein